MKHFRAWILFLALFAAGGPPLFAEAAKEISSRGKAHELVLLHTNDYHGAILPNNERGGLAELAAYIKAVKAVNPDVLLLDAGDFNTGTALSNMFDAEPDILGYNIMGYDAVTFGNHEFDGSREKLIKQMSLASFPFVSSNIKTSNGEYLGGNQYLVKKYNGFTVGIFGITTLRTKVISSPGNDLVFINEIEAAREAVGILRDREKADIVIGLTHLGNIKEGPDHISSVELAAAVPGIDIIVDGHSHTFMEKPLTAGSAYIVSANEWGKYIGRGKLIIKNGKLADFSWVPVPIGPDRETASMLKPFIEKGNANLKEVIGIAEDTFIFGNRLTRYGETAIGNLITDANVWYFKTKYNQAIDFAFHNGGNIRAELPKGPITLEQILTILPFENYLYIASLNGKELLALFNFIAEIPQGGGGFPQFSQEVRFTIDKTAGNGVIRDLTIGGELVDPDRTYRFCTNDYILDGGDGYEVMKKSSDHFNSSLLLSYAVSEYIKEMKKISPVTDGRLKVTGGITP
ncbi:MAG: 5'-nucleotidase C-terminal domain-containing protein [Treponema sp.]|jgi:5'-nucleotidase/UDP-sugar diphosphatase|nr:5'-nucleotidase C-terminal domain-containing protein [Treponema sp.]